VPFGKLDILVNNAGVYSFAGTETSPEDPPTDAQTITHRVPLDQQAVQNHSA